MSRSPWDASETHTDRVLRRVGTALGITLIVYCALVASWMVFTLIGLLLGVL